MEYKINFVYNEYSDGSGKFSPMASAASIEGREDVYIHFAHHYFDIVCNEETRRQESVHGVNKFFGGMGEGSTFDSWQDALLVSLYDAYQVYEGFADGDTFVAEYFGQVCRFRCTGVHVVTEQASPAPRQEGKATPESSTTGLTAPRPESGAGLHVACDSANHNAVNCLHSDLPIAQWCAACRKAWAPLETEDDLERARR